MIKKYIYMYIDIVYAINILLYVLCIYTKKRNRAARLINNKSIVLTNYLQEICFYMFYA